MNCIDATEPHLVLHYHYFTNKTSFFLRSGQIWRIVRLSGTRLSEGQMAEKSETKADEPASDAEFLTRTGATALLRAALLRLMESRPEDPVGFLAEHFGHVCAEAEDGGAEHQAVSRALWHLSLSHHSQRSVFNSNTHSAYDLLAPAGLVRGVPGSLYTEMLQCLCSEGGLSGSTAAPLLRRLRCHDHELVPFQLFKQSVLTCAVFCDYIRRSQCLYAAVSSAPDRPAERELCRTVLDTLREALDTAERSDATRYLEASAKISPGSLAQVMAGARPGPQQQEGPGMDAQEFEDAAAALFIARVRTMT